MKSLGNGGREEGGRRCSGQRGRRRKMMSVLVRYDDYDHQIVLHDDDTSVVGCIDTTDSGP